LYDVTKKIWNNGKYSPESRKPFSFKKKDNELMQDYIDVRIENYVVLDPEQPSISKQEGDNYFEGFWKMSFDGACSKSRSGLAIVFKSPISVIYPHAIILKFPFINNEAKYEALIQGMNLALQMRIAHMIITDDSKMYINHIKNKYNIKKEKLKFMPKE
jgi:hypothetical protein